ncbi:MAG: hypothetical protein J0L62_00180 [Bacteroidetes bacterium]|nr:hypothetical protein [Bacteroidota bacterium]
MITILQNLFQPGFFTRPFNFVLLAILQFVFSSAFSQNERGNPSVINYASKDDYRADRDVWDAAQDSTGTLFFGNAQGVLTYNGVSWSLFSLPKKTAVNSLAVDAAGRVFVGSEDEFGFFSRNKGQLDYTSLMHQVPGNVKAFGKIWSIDTLGQTVYLQALSALFCVTGDSLTTLIPRGKFSFIYRAGSRLFIQDPSHGLLEIKNSRLIPVDTSGFFRQTILTQLAPAPQGNLFLFTRKNGTFLHTSDGVKPMTFALADLSRKYRFYSIENLPDGEFLIGTVGGGAVIVDSTGKILNLLNTNSGLKTNTVTGAFYDGNGSVWLCTYEGVSRIRYPSPATLFRVNQHFSGLPKSTVRHQGSLFQGTLEKFYRLSEDFSFPSMEKSGSSFFFSPIEGIKEDCGMALSVGSDLFVSTNQGVFLINKNGKELVTKSYALPLTQSVADPDRIFVGTYGLQSIYKKNGRWIDEGFYDNITEDIYHVFEESERILWLRSYNQGILRVTLEPGFSRKTKVERYGSEHGLPSLEFYPAEVAEGKIRWMTESGVFTFNEQKSRFEKDTSFYKTFPGVPDVVNFIAPGKPNQFWITKDGRDGSSLFLFEKKENGSYQRLPVPFILENQARIQTIYTDHFGLTWFSVTSGLVRYDPDVKASNSASFVTEISSVHLMPADSVIATHVFSQNDQNIVLNYPNNSLTFRFSALSFFDESRNTYKYKLEGFDSDWSDWTTDTHKEYTNLNSGDYCFKVQSLNALGSPGQEVSFKFVILPPWWESWWFRSLVVLFLAWIGFLVFQSRLNKLKREKKAQEEFSRQLINLQENERKRIAHELHDSISQSLLAIHNRAQMAREKSNQPDWISNQLEVILSSSSGAIQEIKQITHNLRPYLLDRIGLTKALHSLIRQFKETNQIKISAEIDDIDGKLKPGDDIHLYRIIQELLNNVQKHANADHLFISVESESGQIKIAVRDNGVGMELSRRKSGESTGGLGLEGISERVRILNGKLHFESKPGKGTSVKISIPSGETHG